MTGKAQHAYEDVFNYISDNVFSMSTVQSFTTDFEMAMRNAINKLFQNAKSIACYFHYTQALKRCVSQLRDIMHEIHTDDLANSIYQRAQCLPLLPPHLISNAFKDLVTESNKLKNKSAFHPFLRYMRDQWIKKVSQSIPIFLNSSLFAMKVREVKL